MLTDLVKNQFQDANFENKFWTNKIELDNDINMEFVHYHAENKSV
jgi:hypothetical protein